MAQPTEQDLVQLGPFVKGMNNIAREDSIPRDQLRVAQNVDFYPTGKIRTREGRVKKVALAGASNFWSDGIYALVQGDATLYRYIPDDTLIDLFDGFAVDTYNAYCSVNRFIYASDTHQALRVDTYDNSVRPWGIAAPGSPTLTATANGGLDAGTYQVTLTYTTADGEESGAPIASTVDVAEGGGILAALPPPHEAHVTSISVYLARGAGAEVMNYYGAVPVGTTQVQLYKQNLGKPLDTFALVQFPACDFVGLTMGRLFGVPSANPNIVIWSEPGYYGQYNPAKNYVAANYDVDLMAPTTLGAKAEGVFVTSGQRTYFQGGNQPGDFTNNEVYMAGAVRGSLVYVPGSYIQLQGMPQAPVPIWIATNGTICLGMPNGTVLPLTEGRFAAAVGVRCSSVFRELNGVRQALFTMEPPTSEALVAATDSLTVTVVRNGIEIQ